MLFSLENGEGTSPAFWKSQQGPGLHPGSHDDCAVNPGAVSTQVIPEDEGAHAVSQHQIGDAGIFLLDHFFRRWTSLTAVVADPGCRNIAVGMATAGVLFIPLLYMLFPWPQMIISPPPGCLFPPGKRPVCGNGQCIRPYRGQFAECIPACPWAAIPQHGSL